MTLLVFLVVIVAAILHATWNSLVKGGQDKYLNMTGVVVGHIPLAVLALCWFPFPAVASWPYIIAGLLLHAAYQLSLLTSYRMGDFTQVYPLARGIAPLLVAGISLLFLGVHLSATEQWAIVIIGLGITSLCLVRQQDGLRNIKAASFAVLTGCFIASYSLIDGLGARVSGSAIGFYSVLGIGNGIIWLLFMWIKHPHTLRKLPVDGKLVFWVGGSASFIAYALVLWAFTQAPIALVTALRETSIIFALLIGVFFLHEKINMTKVFSTLATLLGVLLIRFAK